MASGSCLANFLKRRLRRHNIHISGSDAEAQREHRIQRHRSARDSNATTTPTTAAAGRDQRRTFGLDRRIGLHEQQLQVVEPLEDLAGEAGQPVETFLEQLVLGEPDRCVGAAFLPARTSRRSSTRCRRCRSNSMATAADQAGDADEGRDGDQRGIMAE